MTQTEVTQPTEHTFTKSVDQPKDGINMPHCGYWGSFGFGVLQRNEYYR
jgi:hypothetical protein